MNLSDRNVLLALRLAARFPYLRAMDLSGNNIDRFCQLIPRSLNCNDSDLNAFLTFLG